MTTNQIIAFAQSEGKPISIPEWGTLSSVTPDDPSYVQGVAGIVKSDDTAYESYFDCGCDSINSLGSAMPSSTSAYTAAFG